MKYLKGIRLFAAALLLLLPAACGGDGNDGNAPNNPTPGNVSISIAPMTANVETGKTATLTVNPQNTGVIWPTLSAAQGSYTTSGNVVTYIAPQNAIEFDFVVTATADPTKTAHSTIRVVPPDVDPPPDADYRLTFMSSTPNWLLIRGTNAANLYTEQTDKWEINGNTLILKDGFTFETTSHIALAINSPPSSTTFIEVRGDVYLAAGSAGTLSEPTSYGTFFRSATTIRGDGHLTVKGGYAPNGSSYGIYMGASNLAIEGGVTITAEAGAARDHSLGIRSGSSVVIKGDADVTAIGGQVSFIHAATTSAGIYSSSATFSDNAKVTAVGGKSAYNSYGLWSSAGITFNDNANVTAIAGEAVMGQSRGIQTSVNNSNTQDNFKVSLTESGRIAAKGLDYAIAATNGAPDLSESPKHRILGVNISGEYNIAGEFPEISVSNNPTRAVDGDGGFIKDLLIAVP